MRRSIILLIAALSLVLALWSTGVGATPHRSIARPRTANVVLSEATQPETTVESTGENGTSESDTHEDPSGQDVNHECPPNCDTVNGEQP